LTNPDDDDTEFDVLAVNIQDNGDRCPVEYVAPPGVEREQLVQNNTVINQNEQSLSLRISGEGLDEGINSPTALGDSRAVFKNVSVDMRQFKKLKMFLHAEKLADDCPGGLEDNQMCAFIRFGNDFTENFYQVEIPLKVTPTSCPSGSCNIAADLVWPEENQIDLALELLTQLKIKAMNPSDPDLQEDSNGIR